MHIYVGNLAPSVTEGDLQHIFQGIGEVVFVHLSPTGTEGRARGYAYVAFIDAEQARIAVDALHGRYLKGTTLAVAVVAERARVGVRSSNAPRPLPATAMATRRTRAAALGLYLVKNATR